MLGNALRRDVNVLSEVAEVLGLRPRDNAPTDSRSGKEVQRDLHDRLEALLQAAPQRGLGAARADFIRHVQAVTARYDDGLFVRYDHPAMPATSNMIEHLHGRVKRHLRKVSGRRSTSGGVAQSIGEWLPGALLMMTTRASSVIAESLTAVTPARYRAARIEHRALTDPARRYRSLQRNPDRFIATLLTRWTQQPGEID